MKAAGAALLVIVASSSTGAWVVPTSPVNARRSGVSSTFRQKPHVRRSGVNSSSTSLRVNGAAVLGDGTAALAPLAAAVDVPSQQSARDAAPAARRTRRPLFAGNWKLNPLSPAAATSLAAVVGADYAAAVRDGAAGGGGGGGWSSVEVAVFPPAVFLWSVLQALEGSGVAVGAQDIYFEDKGAFTGAVAASMVASVGCSYALVGHSERRALFGDDDATIAKKLRAALRGGLRPVLCVGETRAQREGGLTGAVCAVQLGGALAGVSAAEMSAVVIAYEPVWAIGTGLTATPAMAQETHADIRRWLKERYGAAVADSVRILYGGSVTPDTAADLMTCPDVDGCLVGGASLAADAFGRIASAPLDGAATGPQILYATLAAPCKNVLGESPIWSARRNALYWVDIQGQELWELPNGAGEARSWPLPEVAGCCALREGGGFVMGFEGGLAEFVPETGALRRLSAFEAGLATRPNDGRVDRAGNLVVGSYNANHRANGGAIGGLYRLTPPSAGAPAADAKLEEILDYRFRVSNCIAFSADGATMTFCDSPTRRIYQFDYDFNGRLSNRRLMYAMPPDMPGVPDGAIMDAQGGLWVAVSGAGRVLRLVPKDSASSADRSAGAATHEVGVEVRVPVASPTSATIGGARLDTLFITTRGPDGGALYSVKLPEGVRGVAEPEFADASAPAAVAAPAAAAARASGISLNAATVNNLSAAAANGAAAAAAGIRPRGPWGALLQGGAGKGAAEAAAAAATVEVDRMFGQPVRSADDVVRAMQASSLVHWSVKALLSDAPGLAGSLSPAAVASLVRMARAAGPDETGSFLVSTMRIPQEGANIMVRDLMEGFEPTA